MSEGVARLREIVEQLRAPNGCPWDREQTHASLRDALIEECYETIDAIQRADDPNLQEELGDLLLHVVMHSRIAEERGAFQLEDVASTVCEKMVRRHPHVFGDTQAADSAEVLKQWEQIKRAEKGAEAGILDGVAAALPALMRAQTVQKKAARVGFDWPDADAVFEKVDEEIREVREAVASGNREHITEEMGDLLFAVVNLARMLKVESEISLADATTKFSERFRFMERALAAEGRKVEDADMDELNALWDAAKKQPVSR